jgi:hypothetical protein
MAEDALASTIKSIGEQTAASRLVLGFLETGPAAPGETANLKAALDRLSRISGDDYADVYLSIRAVYSSLVDLKDDLETLRQLAALDHDSAEISGARAYIASADVPESEYPNLAIDRETLLTGLSPARLTRSRAGVGAPSPVTPQRSRSATPRLTGSITRDSMTFCPRSKPL